MKKLLVITLLTCNVLVSFGQSNHKKIKIILLGTFHFNQSIDSTSKLHSNLFSEKRQSEIASLVSKLAKQKPDKIFLEFSEKNQAYYDSIYSDYLQGKEPARLKTKANEIFQLGMKTAKILNHKKVIGINYQPEELADSTYKPKNKVDEAIQKLYLELGAFNDETRTNAAFYDLKYPHKLPKQDSLLQKVSLDKYLLHINSEKKLQQADYYEWNYFLSMGTGTDMSSMEYVSTFWYGANLRNFNNILRQVDYKQDNCYLIIYGSNHIPFLKYLFKMNPYFEVLDLNEVLK
jgi:hypothetical protein